MLFSGNSQDRLQSENWTTKIRRDAKKAAYKVIWKVWRITMAFDLVGEAAQSTKGKYFSNNVWWWRPLARFVLDTCDVPPNEAQDWFCNAENHVSAQTAGYIAEHLQALADAGEVRRYAEERERQLASLPDETCIFCEGTGQRHDALVNGQCALCKGTGMMRPWITHYPFSEENVQAFIEFCKHCGGFYIC